MHCKVLHQAFSGVCSMSWLAQSVVSHIASNVEFLEADFGASCFMGGAEGTYSAFTFNQHSYCNDKAQHPSTFQIR